MEETDMLKDIDIDVAALAWIYQKDPRTRRKIAEATNKLNLNIMYPLREGKKLAVLDLDYSTSSYAFWLSYQWTDSLVSDDDGNI